MVKLGYYEIHFTANGVSRATIYETKDELMKAVQVLYEFMHDEDTIEIMQTMYVTNLLGVETRRTVQIFMGNEHTVGRLLKL
jgi:hypothetical protein